jgi:ankyrin repeat protein
MAEQDEFLNAVKRGDEPTVVELLRQQPELITVADEYDKTALHWAAEKASSARGAPREAGASSAEGAVRR